MSIAILGYNLILVAILTTTGLLAADSNLDRLMAMAFMPMAIYFTRRIKASLSRGNQDTAASLSMLSGQNMKKHKQRVTDGKIIDPQELTDAEVKDLNKRLFLKLIGSAGLATFTFAMFTKRAQASFFGSMPVPGSVTLKDSGGTAIDPAEKEPTDGYEVNDVDDTTYPSYYGFVDKDGNWYITQEDSGGAFRYVRGATDYSTNWTNRATQSYDYFSSVF